MRPLALQSPPRKIPARLWLRLVLGRAGMQFGWLWVAAVVWLAVVALPERRWNREFDARATATVERITVERGAEDPDLRIEYVFRDAQGGEHRNYSIEAGAHVEAGSTHEVAYVSSDPRYSELRVSGVRSRYESLAWNLFMLGAFSLVGVIAMLLQSFELRRELGLLRRGRETTAVLVAKRLISNGDDDGGQRPVLAFEYEVDGKPHRYDRYTDLERLEAERQEPVVFHPRHPDYATTFDALPGEPIVDDTGRLRDRHRRIWHVLLLPAVTLAGVATLVALYFA